MTNEVNNDTEHLKLLAIFHYILAGMEFLFACFPIIHLIVGIAMLASPQSFSAGAREMPPPFLPWLFIILAGSFILIGWVSAFCTFLAGRFIAKRTHYTFCFIIAVINCMFMPFGTALGVFTIVVLMRPSVKGVFLKKQ